MGCVKLLLAVCYICSGIMYECEPVVCVLILCYSYKWYLRCCMHACMYYVCVCRFCLGAYGAPSQKPIYGYSNCKQLLMDLHVPFDRATFVARSAPVNKKRNASGELVVSGSAALKATQSGP